MNIVWGPAAAGAACSGDLGWTTGPAEYRRQPGGEVFRRGYYSSIWTRADDGPWKVQVDLGIGTPLDATGEQKFVYLLIWERVAVEWTLRLIVQDAVKPSPAP